MILNHFITCVNIILLVSMFRNSSVYLFWVPVPDPLDFFCFLFVWTCSVYFLVSLSFSLYYTYNYIIISSIYIYICICMYNMYVYVYVCMYVGVFMPEGECICTISNINWTIAIISPPNTLTDAYDKSLWPV